MTKHKNKHSTRTSKHSSSLHTPKSRTNFYPTTFAKKLILAIIFLVFLVVIGATISSFFLTTEAQVNSQISHLATDYYENYFYPSLINSDKFQSLPDQTSVLDNYHTHGLSSIPLDTLLLYDNQKNASYSDFLSEYCDTGATTVTIYPDPPYEKSSYHIEYHYSCDY